MFKIFTVVSLLALLAEGGSAQQSSPWPAVFMLLVTILALVLAFVWLRRRYRIVRRSVVTRYAGRRNQSVMISDDAWKKIVSGEMARRLIGKKGGKDE